MFERAMCIELGDALIPSSNNMSFLTLRRFNASPAQCVFPFHFRASYSN
jgi:hypothetical protein